jgi:hypothetical protein
MVTWLEFQRPALQTQADRNDELGSDAIVVEEAG